MAIAERLQRLLPPDAARLMKDNAGQITQIRLRADRPVQLVGDGFDLLTDAPLPADALKRILAALTDYSLYARQEDMDHGFMTLDDGSRVGVCGRMHPAGAGLRMEEIGSACIRAAREIPGCAKQAVQMVLEGGGLDSILLVSPPGMGKTTMLRDLARTLSERGHRVAIADERHEIAACRQGVPTLDVGPRTDVMDGCPRAQAVGIMIRTMSPEVVVADEIGGEEDAAALEDAARCGVAVAASAHAFSFLELSGRSCMRSILASGVIRRVAVLGPSPGRIRETWRYDLERGESTWARE